MLVAGVTLPFAIPGLLRQYWWVFLIVPVLVVLLTPLRSWSGGARWPSGCCAVPSSRSGSSWPLLLRLALMLIVSWLLLGLHFGALVYGLDVEVASPWLLSIGVFALAWVAGFLVIIAPAGAGVREAALVLGFAAVSPGRSRPHDRGAVPGPVRGSPTCCWPEG